MTKLNGGSSNFKDFKSTYCKLVTSRNCKYSPGKGNFWKIGRMAAIVDEQNAADIAKGVYRPMAATLDSHEFMAALELVFKGLELPNGYTEPVLHDRKIQVKRDKSA